MSGRSCVCLVFIVAVSVMIPVMALGDFDSFDGLLPEEVVIVSRGIPEMRAPGWAVEEMEDWPFAGGDGYDPDQREALIEFIQEHRAEQYETLINPIYAAGLMTKDQLLTRMADGRPNGLTIGDRVLEDERYGATEAAREESLRQALAAAGIEEDGDALVKNGRRYTFEDIEIVYWFQKEPNTQAHPQRRREWGASDFEDFYKKVVVSPDEGEPFTVRSPMRNEAYSPPGDIMFDAGVDNDLTEQEIGMAHEVSSAVEFDDGQVLDITMEVFVELRGRVLENGNVFRSWPEDGEVVGRATLYVEDYLPPLPEDIPDIEALNTVATRLTPDDSSGNAFMPGMARFYRGDGSGIVLADSIDPEQRPTELYFWPNSDPVDRKGDGLNDFEWDTVRLSQGNPNDTALNMTFNYEVGMSLRQRIRYKPDPEASYSDPEGWRYMYYVPYRPINGKIWGPYAGIARSDDPDYEDVDPYAQDGFYEFYQPIRFPEEFVYNGTTYKPLALINYIYDDLGTMGDPAVEIQRRQEQIERDYGFAHVAGISVKWGRECVQGITVGSTDSDLAIPEGVMLLPTGFSSARIQDRGRVGNFSAEYDHAPAHNGPQSLIGTPTSGDDVPDKFFTINAADCCNNDVVIASGTYGAEDNLKPIPKLVIEEMDSHDKDGNRYLDVATVPNDFSGAGDPIGEYHPSRVLSRIHDSSIPLYGTGVQGQQFRGYGNYTNNAATWNGLMTPQTLQNPVDQAGNSFLATRIDAPPFEERRRYEITITADDNVGPDAPPLTDAVYWPIRHLSYVFYHHPTITDVEHLPAGVRGVFNGSSADGRAQDKYQEIAAQVTSELEAAGFRKMIDGAIVDVPEFDASFDDWRREPAQTFEYNFPAAGLWVARVDAVDRSHNGRIMLVPLDVGPVGIRTRGIDMETQRLD